MSFCSKPAAVAAELAARLSRQLHTAAAADWKAFIQNWFSFQSGQLTCKRTGSSCRRLLTEHTAGSIGGRRCSQGQGWDKARWSNYVGCQICKVWSPCSSSRWPCSCSWWWRGSSGPASSWCSSPWGLTRPTCIRPITIATITMVSHTNVPDTAGAPGWLGAVPGQADTWEERVILMASICQRIVRKGLCVKASYWMVSPLPKLLMEVTLHHLYFRVKIHNMTIICNKESFH